MHGLASLDGYNAYRASKESCLVDIRKYKLGAAQESLGLAIQISETMSKRVNPEKWVR